MKRVFFIVLAAFALFAVSCNQKQVENLQAKNDSLVTVGFQKDTTVMEFVKAFNDIQANLDSIKMKENIISQSASGGEMKTGTKERVQSDINSIYMLLQKNKQTVAALRAKLKNAEKGNEANHKQLSELQKMIDNMNKQIDEKNAEIAALKDQLAKMDIKVSDLSKSLDVAEADIRSKQQDIKEKTYALNSAYYLVGTTRELKDNHVISSSGLFGRTTLQDDFNKSLFTRIDVTEIKSIPIFKKKAKVMTSHPASSYKFVGNKTADSLVIISPSQFWANSKYLVVVAD